MKIVSGIYVIRNKQNGKVYIGSSKNIRSRVNSHYSALKRGAHCNRHLQGAWDEYGEQSFEDEILEICPEPELLQREQYWITAMNVTDQQVGYNLSKDTTAPMRGLAFSAETKAKISKANKGKKRTPEFSARMSATHKGYVPTDEARLNMSIANKKRGLGHIHRLADLNRGVKRGPNGRKMSDELKEKIRAAASQPKSEEYKQMMSERNSLTYEVTSPDGEIMIVKGIVRFSREHGLTPSMMHAVARGERTHHKLWKCRKVE